ncbi:16S rRNA (guanine(966)-N(2))-methyltransferase RsmD [Thalassotalea maritima]|uniref:16S rRNA (guanine(966)-N(2))-methyltransferase RsmD n=1 Tax=Thalassotalea maritima TaxID=3242416 RepID=UPI0035271813
MAKKRNLAKAPSTSGQVRIIAGKYRGRKLPVLDHQGLRPTTDRVKETVFNWLMFDIAGAHCLDCYAGSGGLGFEALSRGAEHVSFYELDKGASKQLQTNIQQLNASNASIRQGDCLQLLASEGNRFDVVFIDPPFRQGLAEKTIALLQQKQLLNSKALVYVEVESDKSNLPMPPNWRQLKEKVAGQVTYRLYRVAE